MSYLRAVGAIDTMGASPYKVSGDPTTALIAQLNRFAGKQVAPGTCKPRTVVAAPLPLASTLSNQAATAAVLVLMTRYECVPLDVYSRRSDTWAASGLDNPVGFVTSNLSEITLTIAAFGDSLGYPAAAVGITQRDPAFTPSFPWGTVAIVGGLGVLALAIARRK